MAEVCFDLWHGNQNRHIPVVFSRLLSARLFALLTQEKHFASGAGNCESISDFILNSNEFDHQFESYCPYFSASHPCL